MGGPKAGLNPQNQRWPPTPTFWCGSIPKMGRGARPKPLLFWPTPQAVIAGPPTMAKFCCDGFPLEGTPQPLLFAPTPQKPPGPIFQPAYADVESIAAA